MPLAPALSPRARLTSYGRVRLHVAREDVLGAVAVVGMQVRGRTEEKATKRPSADTEGEPGTPLLLAPAAPEARLTSTVSSLAAELTATETTNTNAAASGSTTKETRGKRHAVASGSSRCFGAPTTDSSWRLRTTPRSA